MEHLGDLRICVERPLPTEEHAIGVMENNSHTSGHFQRLQAAFQTSKLWPKSVKEIKIQFVDPRNYKLNGVVYSDPPRPTWTPLEVFYENKNKLPVDPLEKELYGNENFQEVVKRVYMDRIQPIIPFKLRFVEGNGDVRISFVGGAGSWSSVGTDCLRSPRDEVTLNYGWIDIPTIIHEFCHVLGMIHEHQNPKGNTIDWNEDRVYQWAAQTQGWDRQTAYDNIIKRYRYDQVNGSDYDPQSVMLYFFPAYLVRGPGTQQNMRLSPLDVIWIEKTYAGGAESPSKFYKSAYGESIDETGGRYMGKKGGGVTIVDTVKSRHFWLIVIIAALVIILALAIWYLFIKKNKKRRR